MWSTEAAKHLVDKGNKSEDSLTKDLAKYLGFSLDTIEYLENVIKERDGIIKGMEAK